MGGALTREPIVEKTKQANSVHASESIHSSEPEQGASAGMPLFLQASFLYPNSPGFIQRKVEDEKSEDQEARRPFLQAKLVIGRPDDPYEQEADHVAEIITRGGSSSAPDGGASLRQQSGDQHIQRKCAACAAGRTCSGCRAGEDRRIQAKPLNHAPSASQAGPSAIKTSDSGTPLSRGVRAKVEPVLGTDLSNVKVHSDASANKAAKDIGAKAFTHQNHIWLGPQQSPDDVELMAHEATHVAQQAQGIHSGGSVQRACACGGTGCAACGEGTEEVVIQPKLEVNATRQFEAPIESAAPETIGTGEGAEEATPEAPAEGAQAGGDAVEAESSSAEGEGSAADAGRTDASGSSSGGGTSGGGSPAPRSSQEAADGGTPDGGTPSANATSSNAPSTNNGGAGASSATPSATGGGAGGGGTETTGGEAACTGGGQAKCYDAPSEQPAEEPAEAPPNPEPTRVQEETSDAGEEDAPEPDDCPAEEASSPSAGAPASAAPDGSASAPANATAPAGAAGPDATSAGPDAQPPAGAAAPGAGGPSATEATGGGAPAEAAMSAGSPLDPVIASAEAERGNAVAAYEASSAAMMAASDGTRALRSGTHFAERANESSAQAIRRSEATSRADRFFVGIAGQLDAAIAFASEQLPDRLGAAAESAKSQIAASIETQKLAISARIEQARGQARVDAALARQAVMSQAEAFVADAQAATSAAIESLTATHGETMAQVNELETTTLDGVNTIYADGRTKLEGLGTTVGDECTAKGEEYANIYAGFRHCTENGFWDGDLSERRSIAQENAARSVAKGYHDRIVAAARKRAREVTRAGRKKDRCAVIASAKSTRDTLDEQLTNLTTALETARDAAIGQAGNTRDGLIASINSSLTSTLRQLDRQEHDQRQAADDVGYMQQVMQEQIAHAAASAVQRGVESAVVATQSALSTLQAQFAASNPPDIPVLDQALSQVEQRINTALSDLNTSADGGAVAAQAQLATAAQQGLDALDGVTQSNDEMTGMASGGFTTSMSVIAGTDNFATQRTGFTQQVQQSTAAGSTALGQALGGMREGCGAITGAAKTALTQAAADLEKNLRQSKQGIECEITRSADEAASHEAPAWKMLVAILLVIIVIVIVIAVTILTAGMALGPIATIAVGIAIGAAVGAVTSGLLAIAGNLWSNRSWSQGVAHAVLVGAITGAIGGGIGAGVGLAFKGFSVAAQLGAAMVTAGALDVVTQYVMGGFSFEHFSWTNLGITLVVTVLTFGLAHRAAGARPTGAAATEGTPAPGATPHEAAPPAPQVEEPRIGFGREPAPTGAPSVEEPRIGFGREPAARPPGAPAVEEPRIGFGREPAPPTGAPVDEPRIGFGREPAPRPPGAPPVEEPRIGFGREPAARPPGAPPVDEPRIGFGREPAPRPPGTPPTPEPRIGFGRDPGPKPPVAAGTAEPAVVSGQRPTAGPRVSTGRGTGPSAGSDPMAPRAMAPNEPPRTGVSTDPDTPVVTPHEEPGPVITPHEDPAPVTTPGEETPAVTEPVQDTPTTTSPEETPPAKTPWQRPKGWRLPKDGTWSGPVGDSTFTPNNPRQLGLNEGDVIQYHDGSPDFTPWQHGADLEVPGMTGVHKDDMPLIWEQVARQQGLPSANAAREWLSAQGLTPHHAGGDTVILVPSRLHGGVRHTGGAFELRTGD